MSKQTGGPAFPVSDGAAHRIAMQVAGDNEAKYIAESAKALAGMTLRDYFAAKAMQAGYLVIQRAICILWSLIMKTWLLNFRT